MEIQSQRGAKTTWLQGHNNDEETDTVGRKKREADYSVLLTFVMLLACAKKKKKDVSLSKDHFDLNVL